MYKREFRNKETKDIEFTRTGSGLNIDPFAPSENKSRSDNFKSDYRSQSRNYNENRNYDFRNRNYSEPRGYGGRGYEHKNYENRDRNYSEPRDKSLDLKFEPKFGSPRGYGGRGYEPKNYENKDYENRSYENKDFERNKNYSGFNKGPRKGFKSAENKPTVEAKVRTVQEFLDDINQHISNYKDLNEANAHEIVDYIKSLLIPIHIKFTFEHLSNLEKVIKLRDEYKTLKENNCVEFINIASESDITIRFRFILSTNRHKADFSIPLVQQSNGSMYAISVKCDKLTCELIAKPSNDFTNKYSNEIMNNLSQADYKIYPIKDGTCIHIFYDPDLIEVSNVTKENDMKEIKVYKTFTRGAWVMASKNSFNIVGLVWRGYEYVKVINHVLSFYPEFKIESLDKSLTYNIGFKHPAFHPFGQSKEWNDDYFKLSIDELKADFEISAWLIESVNTDIGIPVQKAYDDIELVKADFNKLKTSLKTYCNHVYKIYIKDPEYMDKKPEIFLGFILRSTCNSSTPGIPARPGTTSLSPAKAPSVDGSSEPNFGSADIIIESSLWQEIRKMIYQLPFITNKQVRDKKEQNFKNIIHIILECYLDMKRHRVFAQLFPQYYRYYNRYNSIIDMVVNKIHDDLTSPNANFVMQRNRNNLSSPVREENPDDKIVNMLCDKLKSAVIQKYTMASSGRGRGRGGRKMPSERVDLAKIDKKIVRNIVMNARFTDTFYFVIHEMQS